MKAKKKLTKNVAKIKDRGEELGTSKKLRDRVDALGRGYNEASATASAGKKEADKFNSEIKELADAFGQETDKGKELSGTEYVVGYSLASSAPRLSVELARQHMDPGVFAQCLTESFDPEKAARLYAEGKIPAGDFKKCLVPGPAQKRIMVKKL